MKKTLSLIILLAVVMTLTSCNVFKRLGFAGDQYMISGEIISLSTDTSVETEEGESAEAKETVMPVYEITVSYEMEDEAGQMETQMLHSDTFTDDTVMLTGRLDATQDVAIVVTKDDEELINRTVSIDPDSNYQFAIIEGGYAPEFVVKGSILKSVDEMQRFAISADLSLSESLNLDTTSIEIVGTTYDDDGNRTSMNFGEVLLEDGVFTITQDLTSPVIATVYIHDRADVYTSVQVVTEPNAEYELVEMSGGYYFAVTTDNDGLHKQLVESWHLDPNYLTMYEKMMTAREAYIFEMEAEWEAEQAAETDENSDAQDESSDELPNLEFAQNNPAAPECEHVDLTAVMQGIGIAPASGEDRHEYFELSDQVANMKHSALQDILYSTSDPMVALYALQLGAFPRDNLEGMIAAYESLATQFDADFVENRITPQIESNKRRLLVQHNDESVIPGQLAPGFTLATFEGEEVSLHGMLQEKEMVLVDFWASWCGPCIASFPALKKMHAAYQEMGFEIVGISIDSTMEAWEGGLEDNVLPWINLGDMKDGEMVGWEAPTATAYGVNFIPKGFLIDSEGCITQKDLPTDKLERVLTGRYGPMPEEELVEEES